MVEVKRDKFICELVNLDTLFKSFIMVAFLVIQPFHFGFICQCDSEGPVINSIKIILK